VRQPTHTIGVVFAAFRIANYRRYVTGQAISLIGTWMQVTAQAWLVLTLTHSSAALGLVVALQTLPVLVLAPYGGVLADRLDKRRLMVLLQSLMGLQALVLGLLTISGEVRLWHVCVLATMLGVNNAFENPARQAFMLEMVGADTLRNAVSLNSVMVNVARAIGPAVAGILIATIGEGVCFLLNAASFAAVIVSLTLLDRSRLSPSPPAPRAAGQLREGFAYAAGTPQIAVPLMMMTMVGTLAYEFQVSLPVMARQGLHRGAEAFGLMTAAMGVGAIVGGLVVAGLGRTGLRPLVTAAASFGVVILFAAAAPSLAVELAALTLVGYASVSFMAIGNATLQLASAPSMRGRVMALWFVAFQGTTPIGGPVIGWVAAIGGARISLALGGASCLVAAATGLLLDHRRSGKPEPRSVLG
jgi:MFS family permease